MLVRIKAHSCYERRTSAIITMGIFQPFNYLTVGKMCQACHTVHGGSASERWGRMGAGSCIICHVTGVALVGGDQGPFERAAFSLELGPFLLYNDNRIAEIMPPCAMQGVQS